MHNPQPREIEFYTTQNGKTPFTEWFETLRDQKTRTRIRKRLQRLEEGNLGDCSSVGDGVYELRLHFGPGIRVYFGIDSNRIVIILCGGDKTSQQRDINRARTYWLEYKETQT